MYALLAALLFSAALFPSMTEAKQPALEWDSITTPGQDDNIIVTPSEVSDIAAGSSGIVYAIDSDFSGVYRSDNAGISWEEIDDALVEAGAVLPASKIALAPDDSNMIAVVTDTATKVYISMDGGDEWEDTFVPLLEGTIQTIAVSSQYSRDGDSFREIAIGTAAWGDDNSTGQLWTLQLGSAWSTWQNEELSVDPAHTGAEVSSIAYSPAYSKDGTLLVVASTGNDVAAAYQQSTFVCAGKWDIGTEMMLWDSFTDYPLKIDPAGDAPGVSYIHSSQALPSDYYSEEEESRQLLVSYDREPDDGDDVYRIDDTIVHRLDADEGNAIDICNLAYYGTIKSGLLLAGDTNAVTGTLTVQVRRAENPFYGTPTWELASVPPTGPGNARVAWSKDGKIAYCGTGQNPGSGTDLDESALSASTDDGDRWRQMGLMDTVIEIADLAVTPSGNSLFVSTSSTSGPEGIWGSAGDPLNGHWYRLLTMDTTSNTIILRLSPDYEKDETLYAAEVGGTKMALSHSRGNTWEWHFAPGPVIDLAVEDEETLYAALPDGEVSKSTNWARTWLAEPVETELPGITMLTLATDGTLFAGGTNGEIAYSTDRGKSFDILDEPVGGNNGNVQLICDIHYNENGIIYAATDIPDSGIWRWVIDKSSEWEQIDKVITGLADGQEIGGFAMGIEGTLYALRLEPASSDTGGVTRALNPTAAEYCDNVVEFELVNESLPAGASFKLHDDLISSSHYPIVSGDDTQNDLWALDSGNQLIYHFEDILCKSGPELDEPEDESMLPVGPCSCEQVARLFLGWDELEGAEIYEAVIYRDPECIENIWMGSSSYACDDIRAGDGANAAVLMSNTSYYWRMRSIEPLISPWSEIRSFTIALADKPFNVFPASGSSNIMIQPAFSWDSIADATGYEFFLASDSEFNDVLVELIGRTSLSTTAWKCSIDLDYSSSYFWKVRGVSDISYGDWVVSSFSTMEAPATTITSSTSQTALTIPQAPASMATVLVPFYIYVIIGLAFALVIVLLILIRRTSR